MLVGCYVIGEPGVEIAEKHLKHDKADLQHIIEWMQDTEYEYVAFERGDEFMLGNVESLPIPEEIRSAVEHLLNHRGYRLISMNRKQNTIRFQYWSSIHDQSCGIAFVIDENGSPDVDYMTLSEPLSVNGWYYYYVDVNEWRVQNAR